MLILHKDLWQQKFYKFCDLSCVHPFAPLSFGIFARSIIVKQVPSEFPKMRGWFANALPTPKLFVEEGHGIGFVPFVHHSFQQEDERTATKIFSKPTVPNVK